MAQLIANACKEPIIELSTNDKRKIANHINAQESDCIYLVNTEVFAEKNWNPNRKTKAMKMVLGEIQIRNEPGLTAIKNFIDQVNGLELVTIKSSVETKEINSFMKKHPLKKEDNFKILSTSKDF